MAFQQQQARPVASRSVIQIADQQQTVTVPLNYQRAKEESKEWILFSPTLNDAQSTTSQTPRTATNWSDFGSLETRVRSHLKEETDTTWQSNEADDDSADLDSLDDGLHAFHHIEPTHLDHSGGTVLPTHDGLGTFPSSSRSLQEHLWQFERHNPRRRRFSQQSQQDAANRWPDLAEEQEQVNDEDDKTARIEKWRLDQSRAVLEEIERETRHRRRRLNRLQSTRGQHGGTITSRTASGTLQSAATTSQSVNADILTDQDDVRTSESFWQRITRRVLQDLIGLDEQTLAVIFGESLLEEDASTTPTLASPLALAAAHEESRLQSQSDPRVMWDSKLLERVARELGILVHQFTENSAAFSTYMRTQTHDTSAFRHPSPLSLRRSGQLRQRRKDQSSSNLDGSALLLDSTLTREAAAALPDQIDTSLWGIEEEPDRAEHAEMDEERREYWETEVDMKMIFRYLKSRLSPASASSPIVTTSSQLPLTSQGAGGPLPAHWVTDNSNSVITAAPDSHRRAEVIRQQHPLVSRAAQRAAAQSKRRDALLRRHQLQNMVHRRTNSSSCASQSTRRSRCTRSGSSRHYWDLGGSAGSGSGPAMSSALGAWGEV